MPRILEDEHTWDAWRPQFAGLIGRHYHWLDPKLRIELLHFQNFLNSVNEIVVFKAAPAPPSEAAVIARGDFVHIAASLERLAVEFLKKQAHRFKVSLPKDSEKVTEESNRRWLEKTELFKYREGQLKGAGKGGSVR